MLNSQYKRLVLLPNKDKSILRKHPWLFSGAIAKKDSNINLGDIVTIVDKDNNYLATGLYEDQSIAVKILSFDKVDIDQKFITNRVAKAIELRKTLNLINNNHTNIFRLINAEGDFLPGLIVDYYDNNLVIQFHSIGFYRLKDFVVNALLECLPEVKTIFSKSSSTLPKSKDYTAKDEFVYGNSQEDFFIAKENDISYLIDYKQGQKTGFFIDQQTNRAILCSLSKGKKVLNCFSYTGGFSLSALKGGATQVDSVDISNRALQICQTNAQNNHLQAFHNTIQEDVLHYLDTIEKGKYDIIVLDPPAFAKHNKDLKSALKGYRTINQKAIEKVKKGGLIFTFSCSQVVSYEEFNTMVFSCSNLSGRQVRVIDRLKATYSHCQSIYHPEGAYLKGLLLYVD